MGVNDKWYHKCPFCGGCFSPDNIYNLLSQAHLNKCKLKDYKSIEESEINEERRKKIITNPSNGTKGFSNERQIDDLWDFLDEVEPKNQLSRISFATYGAGIIKGYEKVQSFIQSIVERLGGTYFSAKEELNSLFVVTLLPKRFLKAKITIWSTKNWSLSNFLLLYLLAIAKKKITNTISTKSCPCTIDPNHNGVKEYPILLFAYYSELKRLFPNDEKKVDSLFKSFLKRSKFIWMSCTMWKETGW